MDSQPTFTQASTEESQETSRSAQVTPEVSTGAIAPIQHVSNPGSEEETDLIAKGYETARQIIEELLQILSSYQQVFIYGVLAFLTIVFIRLTFVAIDTIHTVPFFAFIFELIGLSASIWFAIRYLLRVSTRAELREELTGIRSRFISPAADE